MFGYADSAGYSVKCDFNNCTARHRADVLYPLLLPHDMQLMYDPSAALLDCRADDVRLISRAITSQWNRIPDGLLNTESGAQSAHHTGNRPYRIHLSAKPALTAGS